jgi:thioredoxin-like negative regulator of GroEL
VKIDVDQSSDGALQYGVRSVPTVMIFNGESEVFRTSGARPDTMYKEILNTL